MTMETGTVIVGGGVQGRSVAYHLTQAGERDVLLIDTSELGAATTRGTAVAR